jgi:hypothetical protein
MPGPLGSPDHPRAYYYGTVIRIGNEYRMWYTGMDSESRRLVCFALSSDGVEWKPNLGLVEYLRGKQNNLVLLDGNSSMRGAICLVLYEPDDPNPARRFKMVREISPTEIVAAFSPDGLRWKSFGFGRRCNWGRITRSSAEVESSRAVSSDSTVAIT